MTKTEKQDLAINLSMLIESFSTGDPYLIANDTQSVVKQMIGQNPEIWDHLWDFGCHDYMVENKFI